MVLTLPTIQQPAGKSQVPIAANGDVTLPVVVDKIEVVMETATPSVAAKHSHTWDTTTALTSLLPKDWEKLENLKISDEWVKRTGIKRVSDFEARVELGISFKDFKADLSGLLIPYLDPSDGALITVRLKRDTPEVEDGKKQNKYRSPQGKVKPLYFVPGVNYADPEAEIVFVESEMSAIAVAALAERKHLK